MAMRWNFLSFSDIYFLTLEGAFWIYRVDVVPHTYGESHVVLSQESSKEKLYIGVLYILVVVFIMLLHSEG
jgi:hypothetical protein